MCHFQIQVIKLYIFVLVFSFFSEIGAVLLNLKSGAIESEFHKYVRPTRKPILSDYCINLTGISQEFIDRQLSFTIVFATFVNWLQKLSVEKQLHYATPNKRNARFDCNTAFCTWTHWDLNHYIRLDCQRNNVQWPANMRAWIDARKIFEVSFLIGFKKFRICEINIVLTNFVELTAICLQLTYLLSLFIFQRTYPGRYTFAEAIKYVSIEQVGDAHSAIGDAKTLAKMLQHLYRRGANLTQLTDWQLH